MIRINYAVCAEHTLQTLRPAHGHASRRDGLVGGGWTCTAAHAPMGRRHCRTQLAVRREHPVESRQVHPWRRHQGSKACHQIQRLQHDVRIPDHVDR